MVKKIRRKLKVVKKKRSDESIPSIKKKVIKKVKMVAEQPIPDHEEIHDVEEMEDLPEKMDDHPVILPDDNFDFAPTVTASPDVAKKMKSGLDPTISLTTDISTDEGPEIEPKPDEGPEIEPEPDEGPEETSEPESEPEQEPEIMIADMEPYDQKLEEDVEEDFDKHREAIEASFDLQEKVMKEIEEELFKKEEEVRVEVENIAAKNPQGFSDILANVKDMDNETIKDFVVAAETLYNGRLSDLPGEQGLWKDLKKKAGLTPKAIEKNNDNGYDSGNKAEEYRRREKAIDIFRNSLFATTDRGFGSNFASPLKARALQKKKESHSSHFFGPSVDPESISPGSKSTSMNGFLKLGQAADITKTESMDLDSMQKLVGELKLEMDDAKKQLADSKKQMAEYKTKHVTGLEDQIDELHKQMKARDIEIKDLRNRLEESEARISTVAVDEDSTELHKIIDGLNFDLRSKNDIILNYESEIKNLKKQIFHQKEIAKKAENKLDDRSKIEQIEEINIKEEELRKLEENNKRNLEELKEIARDNMKSEYRLKRKEMLLDKMEKSVEEQRKVIDQRVSALEKAKQELQIEEEMLEDRNQDFIKKEEDIKIEKEKLIHEWEELEEKERKIKANLREQSRMDYRIDKRQQDLRIQESKLKELQEDINGREEKLKIEEKEATKGGIDPGRLDEVLKMKSLELARKEEMIKAQVEDVERRKAAYDAKMKMLEEEGKDLMDGDTQSLFERIRKREIQIDSKEEELRDLEMSLKQQWSKVQAEARRVASMSGSAEAPSAASTKMKPLLRVRCVGCKDLIPIYSNVRPLKVQCPKCGSSGILK